MIASSPTEAKQMALFLITLIELSFLNTENSLKLYLLRKSPNFIELVCIYKSIFNHNKLYRLMSLQPENKAPGDVTQHNPMSGTQYDSPPPPTLYWWSSVLLTSSLTYHPVGWTRSIVIKICIGNKISRTTRFSVSVQMAFFQRFWEIDRLTSRSMFHTERQAS